MEYWQHHNQEMYKLKQIYNRISKQTQNKLQEIFDTYNFTSENLYNIADNKTKNRINITIEEWKDKGLLKEYFGILAKNIYNRTRVKNSEILELLIYGAYIEEQSKLDEYEKQIMYDDINYYYEEGQQEVLKAQKKKKPISIIDMALFLYLLEQINLEQYIQMTIQYNAQQMYKQALINIQQQKELEIENNEFQRVINQQQNTKLCINNDKISGFMDNQLIGLNNQAKVEGIKEVDNNAKVRFIAVEDSSTTDMCHSLDGQTFYINKENVFDRYYGETQKELRIQRIKCKGLVLGLNLPPISHHFHWCRSTITYQASIERKEKIEYNLDIPKISKEIKRILGNTELNSNIKKLFNKYLTSENTEIDNTLDVPMRYSIEKDKIFINPKHSEFQYYDLQESLSHEIIHMIDIRNNISKSINIDNELRRARLSIDIDEDKYINMLNSSKYEDNMLLGDIFSAVTTGKITGNFGHDKDYWLKDITRIKKEMSANIMSAYLNNNKDTLDILDNITGLKEIKEKVVKEYGVYTR